MKQYWMKHKTGIIALIFTVCLSGAFLAGSFLGQSLAADRVVESEGNSLAKVEESEKRGQVFENETMKMEQGEVVGEDILYKEIMPDEEIGTAVCKKFNLDYATVSMDEINTDMRNYEEALWLYKEMGDRPLLENDDHENEDVDFSSLEIYICDIYAFDRGREVIEKLCSDYGVNPQEAVVHDLTEEQLIEIGKEAYNMSDHPKN